MTDLIERAAAIDAVSRGCQEFRGIFARCEKNLNELPSAEPDFSCDGCQTPKHICGICMRNYPNITDHYCTGEAWKEVKDETAV